MNACVGCDARFALALAARLRAQHPELVNDLDESLLQGRVRAAIVRALQQGHGSHDAIVRHVVLMFALEPYFERRFRIREYASRANSESHPNCWYRADRVISENAWQSLLSESDDHPHIQFAWDDEIFVSIPQLSANYGFQLDVPFVETPIERVHDMLRLACVGPADVVLDLGCGDGRLVLTAAGDYGARGIGIDLNPELIERARNAATQANVADRVTFLRADFHDADLSEATVVVLYLLRHVNLALRDRLRNELRPGARIVSRHFDMGDWEPHAQITHNNEPIYCWRIATDARPARTDSPRTTSRPSRV